MKKVMKIVGIIVLVIIILVAAFFIKAAFTPAVPKDYTETVKTRRRDRSKVPEKRLI